MEENIVPQVEAYLLWSGLAIGALLGAIVQRTNFCMANCFTSIRIFGSFLQFKAYMVALLVAMAGAQALYDFGVFNPLQSIYLPKIFPVLGFIVGGYLFGTGMVWAGGCATRILVRTGEGHMGALISLFAFNITAGSTLAGHLAYTNAYFFRKYPITFNSPSSIPALIGINPWIVIGLFALFLAVWFIRSAKDDDFLGIKWPVTGIAIGLLIVAGWYVTGSAQTKIVADDFLAMDSVVVNKFRPTSLTFAKPNADFFSYIATATGSTINFGIATVIGVFLGSFITAQVTRTFHWVVPPDKNSFLGHLAGGCLMGFGAIIALGCNFGQGITGLSLLGLGGLITTVFILLGSWTSVWIKGRMMKRQ